MQVVEQLISPGNMFLQPRWTAGLSSNRLGPPAWQANHLQAGNVTVSSSGISTAIQHADEPAGATLFSPLMHLDANSILSRLMLSSATCTGPAGCCTCQLVHHIACAMWWCSKAWHSMLVKQLIHYQAPSMCYFAGMTVILACCRQSRSSLSALVRDMPGQQLASSTQASISH